MLIALVIFFVIILLFFLSFTMRQVKGDAFEMSRQHSMLLISKLAGTPEFSCANSKAICVDADKLLSLKDHKLYRAFWNVAGLKVEKVILDNSTLRRECTTGNYPLCTTFTLVENKTNTIADSSFVSLCRREYQNGYSYDKCELSQLIVWTEKKS